MPSFEEKIQGLYEADPIREREVPSYGYGDLANDLLGLQWERMKSIKNPLTEMTQAEQLEWLSGFAFGAMALPKGVKAWDMAGAVERMKIFNAKGYRGRVTQLTPKMYFEKLAVAFNQSGKTNMAFVQKDSGKRIEKYAKNMLEGDLFPIPMLTRSDFQYSGQAGKATRYFHEGRRRALAAKSIGAEKMPVLVLKSSDKIGQVPKFRSTEEALVFGREAIPSEVAEAKFLRSQAKQKSRELLKTNPNQAMEEAVRGQFYREMIEEYTRTRK